MIPTVTVNHLAAGKYRVTVQEGASKTVHEVTVSPTELKRYGKGHTPERLLEASFEFLLEHEPKESILRRFELSVIETYFPTYPKEIANRL
jgi:hypothetical protein